MVVNQGDSFYVGIVGFAEVEVLPERVGRVDIDFSDDIAFRAVFLLKGDCDFESTFGYFIEFVESIVVDIYFWMPGTVGTKTDACFLPIEWDAAIGNETLDAGTFFKHDFDVRERRGQDGT